MRCRHCGAAVPHVFLDLGFAPPSNAYLTSDELSLPEPVYPLRLRVCHACWLVQAEAYAAPDALFRHDYAYYSSTSAGWLAHAKRYAAQVTKSLRLDTQSFVIEVGANDGYLLRNFVDAGIPCLGIEPTAGTAEAAERLGIPILREFFTATLGASLAADGRQANLIIGNNVYAHVPDVNDFTRGLKAALKPSGTITLEWPHLLQLIQQVQFDTVYHEHFSYFSLLTVQRILADAGLRVFDVETLPTHGGSLRVFACHAEDRRPTAAAVDAVLADETSGGLQRAATYDAFQQKADRVKDELLTFLVEQKRAGKTVAAFGAAAKGNTMLNYAGVKPDLLPFVCDAAAAKQGRFMPGSHIPIVPPSALNDQRPDYVLILPWNIADEIIAQLAPLHAAGTQFVTAIPTLQIR